MDITYIESKTILTKAKGEHWFGIDYTMNLYRGCHHGCIYCDSRSDVYQNDNFDLVKVKENALEILEKELKSKRKKGVISTGAMSDPYNKLDEKLKLSREALKLINKYQFGVAIATKSDLVVRDIDILKEIAKHSPVIIKISITCLDDKLTKLIEPNVSLSIERFEALRKLREANLYAGILLVPVIPFLTDNIENIKGIIDKGIAVDTSFIISFLSMTQRTGQRKYYLDKLGNINPDLVVKHNKAFRNNYVCLSPTIKEIHKFYQSYLKEKSITYKMKDITNNYKKPYIVEQLSLF